MSEIPAPPLPPPNPGGSDSSAGGASGRAGFHFPEFNRRTGLRLAGVTLACCALLGSLFMVLVQRKGGRAASGPVVVSAMPTLPPVAAPAPDSSAAQEPQRPLALPFGPLLGHVSRFAPRVRFSPPILPVDTRSFEADGIAVTIAEMETPLFEAVCFDAQRNLWACGRYARAALFNRIRHGTLVCQARGGGFWHCEHNGEDVALWMIRLGWARPTPGSPLEYTSAMMEAQEAKAGLWNGGWTYVNLDTMGTPRGPQALTPPPARLNAGGSTPRAPADARRDRQRPQKTD